MKATVREYTVKKKVVVVELDMDEVERVIKYGIGGIFSDVMTRALESALEADRASDAKEDEDVPF